MTLDVCRFKDCNCDLVVVFRFKDCNCDLGCF